MSNASDLRTKSVDDLRTHLVELRREQFNLRMQKAARQLSNTARFKEVRREVARVHTLLTEMKTVESKA